MSTSHLDEATERKAAREIMVRAVCAAAEVMGGRKLSDEALGVLAERAARDPETGKAALRWLSENDSGTLTLAKLVKAINDIGPAMKQQHGAGGGCAANGCPMHGTINTGGPRRCRFHLYAAESGPGADAITRVLRSNADTIAIATKLSNDPSKDAWDEYKKLELHLSQSCREAEKEATDAARERAGQGAPSAFNDRTEMLRQARGLSANLNSRRSRTEARI